MWCLVLCCHYIDGLFRDAFITPQCTCVTMYITFHEIEMYPCKYNLQAKFISPPRCHKAQFGRYCVPFWYDWFAGCNIGAIIMWAMLYIQHSIFKWTNNSSKCFLPGIVPSLASQQWNNKNCAHRYKNSIIAINILTSYLNGQSQKKC